MYRSWISDSRSCELNKHLYLLWYVCYQFISFILLAILSASTAPTNPLPFLPPSQQLKQLLYTCSSLAVGPLQFNELLNSPNNLIVVGQGHFTKDGRAAPLEDQEKKTLVGTSGVAASTTRTTKVKHCMYSESDSCPCCFMLNRLKGVFLILYYWQNGGGTSSSKD